MKFLAHLGLPRHQNGACVGSFEDWLPYSNFCYQKIDEGKSWFDANKGCSDAGGSLAVAHNDALMQAIIQHTTGTDHWLGLKKDENEDGK